MKITKLGYLLQLILVLALCSTTWCYAQDKLHTVEDIRAFNDSLFLSLKESKYTEFSEGIGSVWIIANEDKMLSQIKGYWENKSKQCGSLNEVKEYNIAKLDERIVRLSYLIYYDLRPVILHLTYYKAHEYWRLMDFTTKERADDFFNN